MLAPAYNFEGLPSQASSWWGGEQFSTAANRLWRLEHIQGPRPVLNIACFMPGNTAPPSFVYDHKAFCRADFPDCLLFVIDFLFYLICLKMLGMAAGLKT